MVPVKCEADGIGEQDDKSLKRRRIDKSEIEALFYLTQSEAAEKLLAAAGVGVGVKRAAAAASWLSMLRGYER